MSNEVYANNLEVSCKQAAGKSICAFPDVCFTPPLTPPTPPGVPIPYPNTGMASDASDGSSSVTISGQEVMLKNKSYFKKSAGDEAGSAPKKSVVTSTNRGKVYYNAWSMDVKFEGENVVRHLDITTHNHGSAPGGTPPMPYQDRMTMINVSSSACKDEIEAIENACKPKKKGNPKNYKCPKAEEAVLNKLEDERKTIPKSNRGAKESLNKRYNAAVQKYSRAIDKSPCQKALRCALVPYGSSEKNYCCKHQTPDHLILGSSFFKNKKKGIPYSKVCEKYNYAAAPCMCAEGGATQATHGLLGRHRNRWMKLNKAKLNPWTVEKAAECGAYAANKVNPQCSKKCIQEQLIQQHEDMGGPGQGPPRTTRIRRMQDSQRPETVARLDAFGVPS